MKTWIPILILFLAVAGLCIWDGIYTSKIFKTMQKESDEIFLALSSTSIEDENLQTQIFDLNSYWTKKMDLLCISLSRKDLQPISDYLQYLCSACQNESQEDAITYSRLLNYNIKGLGETSLVSWINLL